MKESRRFRGWWQDNLGVHLSVHRAEWMEVGGEQEHSHGTKEGPPLSLTYLKSREDFKDFGSISSFGSEQNQACRVFCTDSHFQHDCFELCHSPARIVRQTRKSQYP